MTLATILTLLRRQLREVTPENWTDDVLKDIINVALAGIQNEILALDPEAFLEFVRRNIEADESYYARPDGSWWPNQVRLKDATTGVYSKLEFKPFDIAETWTGKTVWSRRGRYVCIFPAPEAAITAGLELINVPTLTLTADTDVPPVPIGIHMAIVYLSKLHALGETYQDASKDEAMVAKILGVLSKMYSTTGGENLSWRPNVKKALGYAG